jgi:hypothetical protein
MNLNKIEREYETPFYTIPKGKNISRKKKGMYKYPRRFSRKKCEKTLCKSMGFTQKASCRPYKNCYKKTRRNVVKRRMFPRT